jgi:hypothetical protein
MRNNYKILLQEEVENMCKQLVSQLPLLTHNLPSINKLWTIIFPSASGRKWYLLTIVYSDNQYFFSEEIHFVSELAISNKGNIGNKNTDGSAMDNEEISNIKIWKPIITDLLQWLKFVKKDWQTAHAFVLEKLPYKYRTGVLNEALAQKYLQKKKQRLNFRTEPELKLSKAEIKKFVQLVESNYFYYSANAKLDKPTAALYFEYCRVAYLATEAKYRASLKTKSGKELYKIFADNRHEFLLDINENSNKIFEAWCNGDKKYRDSGGHPFEIIRGGGSNQLYLRAEKDYYSKDITFGLSANTRFKLVEMVKIALAFHKNKMPFTIHNPLGLRLCLLMQNKSAIVAEQDETYDLGSEIPEENIYNFYCIDDFGKNFNKLKPFVTWNELPILRYIDDRYMYSNTI